MDDVLASIRRIVRAETEPDAAEGGAQVDAPAEAAAVPEGAAAAGTVDAQTGEGAASRDAATEGSAGDAGVRGSIGAAGEVAPASSGGAPAAAGRQAAAKPADAGVTTSGATGRGGAGDAMTGSEGVDAGMAQAAPDAGPDEMQAATTPDVRSLDAPPLPQADASGEMPPLLLTPEMRADRVRPASSGPEPSPPASAEREILRGLIAEILAAELRDGAAGDALREIIRDELMNGSLGRNATENVRAMIRAEIAATHSAHPEHSGQP